MASLHFQVGLSATKRVSMLPHQPVSVRVRSGTPDFDEPPPVFLDMLDPETGCRIGTIRLPEDEAEKVRLDLTDIRNKRESDSWG